MMWKSNISYPEDEVLFTDGNYRLIRTTPGPNMEPGVIIPQHNCPVGGSPSQPNRWKDWISFVQAITSNDGLGNTYIRGCATCKHGPSEGLSAMYLFLVWE